MVVIPVNARFGLALRQSWVLWTIDRFYLNAMVLEIGATIRPHISTTDHEHTLNSGVMN